MYIVISIVKEVKINESSCYVGQEIGNFAHNIVLVLDFQLVFAT